MGNEVHRGHQELLVLEALRTGRAHGYGIIQLLRLRSGGAFDLAEGTVYPVLRKLENERLVKSAWAEVQGRRRRVYQLTAAGRRELAERKEAWRRFSTAMVVVLGGS